MTIQEMDDLANKINALGDNSAAKERDIVEMFHRSGAAAKAAGVQYDDTLAILTAIRSTGMQEEVASRWFNAFAFDLAGAHTKGDKVQDAWKLLGFDPKAISQGMTKDATGTIMKVFDAINKLDQMKKVEVLSKIFGQGWQDETARAAQAVAEVRKQLDYIRDQKNWQGSLKTNLDIQMATIDSHWKRLTASVTNAAEALDRVSGASSGFKDLSEGLKSAFEWASGVMTNAAKRNEEIERNKRRQEAARRERQLMEDLQAKEAAVATAERDPGPFDPGGLMRLNIDPQDARRRLERLRMERTELQLAVEATKERPALDLTPSPPPRPAASALPHKPKRLPVDLPPVQILEDIVPRTAEGKVRASMDGLNRALAEGGDKAVAESKSIVERIKELFGSLNFTVTPTISPRFGGGPAGGPGSAVPQSAPAPATGAPLQRQARAGGLVITGPVSFHGIRDLAGAHRELARLADRDVAEARDSALHDTWTYA